MSRGNAEFASRSYDAFRRQDVESLVALHDPTCEIEPLIVHVEGGAPYRGHEGVRAFWRDVHAAFEDWCPEPQEVRAYGDSVVVRIRFQGRGRDSGATIDQHVWQAVRLRGGRAEWWAIYPTAADALEAVGLRE